MWCNIAPLASFSGRWNSTVFLFDCTFITWNSRHLIRWILLRLHSRQSKSLIYVPDYILSSLSWSWMTSPVATRANSSRFFFNFLLLFGFRWIKPLVDVLLNEHWPDGFNSLKKANIKHWSDGFNSLKMANIKKNAWKHVYSQSDIGNCIIKWKPASQGMRQRMDKVRGSNLNFLIVIGHFTSEWTLRSSTLQATKHSA